MNKTLKDTENYILLLNNKIYLRGYNEYSSDYTFTTNYNVAIRYKSLNEIGKLQRKFGGKVLELKEKIWVKEVDLNITKEN